MKTQTLIDDAAAPDRLPSPPQRVSWKMSWMKLQGQLMQGRKQLGLTQDEVAAHLGISRSKFQRIELGHSVPNAFELFCWADLLGIEITSAKSINSDASVPA